MLELSDNDLMTLTSGIEAFTAKEFPLSYKLLHPLAELGHPDAQYRLAVMAQNGLGMVVNPKASVHWMTAAAEQGFDLAQHGLGFMYMQGECVTQDNTQAAHWFRLAAKQGLTGAQMALEQLNTQ